MTDLFWPGDHRAGDLMSDSAFLAAMVTVEDAWLDVLVRSGIAPAEAKADLIAAMDPADAERIATGAEDDGSPVVGLVALLRERTGEQAARWLHRGLTSQDVVDTALMLCLRDAMLRVDHEIAAQITTLSRLVEENRSAPALARTLSQPALPTTVGAKIAGWLNAVLDAADSVAALPPLPAQVGGAVGSLAAATELTRDPDRAIGLADDVATTVGLAPRAPWHTTRAIVTRTGDALVTCCDAWGHIAGDVVTGSRAEVGEFVEGRGGGSSTMPHKRNPVLSVLIRRAALSAPGLGATLHAASADSVDERSSGGWQTEWATLRTLTRRTVVAAAQTTDLLNTLQASAARAAANLDAGGDLLAEQRVMADLVGEPTLPGYTGATQRLIDATLARARNYLRETS
ncbi:MAG: 3-carboxy-cis,cis-muconate cycloisomerase [Mycobacterium sp.]|nr:3-carboxy-cis,cis-muconate cycloisomerase [Mycobacterium sp.]